MKLITDAMAQTEQPAAPGPTGPAPHAATPAAPTTQTSTGANGAYDPNQQPPSLPEMMAQLIPIFVVMGIVYILVIRPRARREKAALESLRNVRRGDIIVTNGGIIGKVTKSVDENEIELEIAQNTRIRLARSAVADVRSKGEPVKDAPAAPAKPAKPANDAKAKS